MEEAINHNTPPPLNIKQEALSKCCSNVSPLFRHWPNIEKQSVNASVSWGNALLRHVIIFCPQILLWCSYDPVVQHFTICGRCFIAHYAFTVSYVCHIYIILHYYTYMYVFYSLASQNPYRLLTKYKINVCNFIRFLIIRLYIDLLNLVYWLLHYIFSQSYSQMPTCLFKPELSFLWTFSVVA